MYKKMSKTQISRVVAHTQISPNVLNLLAINLNISMYEINDQHYTWIENCAGVRIGKIKHGKYNIHTLQSVLYPIMFKLIEPSVIYKLSEFILVSENGPISLNIDSSFANFIHDDTIQINHKYLRVVKCGDLYLGIHKYCEIAGKNNVYSVYRNKDLYYIRVIYSSSGMIYEYTPGVEYNLDLIKDLFGYEIHDYVAKYYNSYIYNYLYNGVKYMICPTVMKKLYKLYEGLQCGELKDGERRIDIKYIKRNLCKVQSIQKMCGDHFSRFKSIYKYISVESIPILFTIR